MNLFLKEISRLIYLELSTEGSALQVCFWIHPFALLNPFLLCFLYSRTWFWSLQDVTCTDIPQLHLGAERRDPAHVVKVQQL